MNLGRTMRPAVLVLCSTLPLSAVSGRAAEVVVLKSTETPSWRPAIDALKRVAASHSVSEFDLRGERSEVSRVLAGLKGRSIVVVAMGPLAAQTTREVAPELPMVFCMVQDPVKIGLAGNAAGIAFNIPAKNQLAAFRLVYPRGTRLGLIYNPSTLGGYVQEAQKSAAIVRLIVVGRSVTSDREVPQALRDLIHGPDAVDALWVLPDPVVLSDESRRFILSETLKAGKPVFSFSSALVAEGALASNGPDFGSIGEQAGELVNRIASGDRAARVELLVPRAELVINQRIAAKLKIEIPAEALSSARKVF